MEPQETVLAGATAEKDNADMSWLGQYSAASKGSGGGVLPARTVPTRQQGRGQHNGGGSGITARRR